MRWGGEGGGGGGGRPTTKGGGGLGGEDPQGGKEGKTNKIGNLGRSLCRVMREEPLYLLPQLPVGTRVYNADAFHPCLFPSSPLFI